jgi:hypothetical protein
MGGALLIMVDVLWLTFDGEFLIVYFLFFYKFLGLFFKPTAYSLQPTAYSLKLATYHHSCSRS